MRKTVLFNDNWFFHLGDGDFVNGISISDVDWKQLTLPHDWSVEHEPKEDAVTGGGGGFATAGIGWYCKHFVVVETDILDKCCILQFDGVYMDSAIYLNGEVVGGHGYGYSSFTVELTGKLRVGENVICVRVDNSHQPNCRWYSGSGIYRNVWLISMEKVHLAPWGLRCDTNGIYFEQDEASLQIRALITNNSEQTAYTGIIHKLYDREGNLVSTSGTALHLKAGETSDCMVRPSVKHPHLWTNEDPYLYRLESTVVCGDDEKDTICTPVGIRMATFDCDKGFLLNGKSVKIKGMCLHHDCGMTGAVGYKEVWRRRLLTLKDMGCNGIRCSHNPPAPEFLDLCDELGFLVMDEIYDEWMLTKNKTHNYYSQAFAYGSSQFFVRDAEKDLVTMLHRDYNHPSVILWSIGNEIPEQSSLDGVKILHFLQDICHREDSSRMVTCACDNIVAVEPNRTLREFENTLDVVGYNYVGRWRERAETFYEEDRALYPRRCMIGSENPSVGGVRGRYHTTGWGNYITATMHHEALWRYTISHDFVAGDYLWTGIDYLGETRWPSRGAAFAPIDTAGFAKDSFYYFRSIWNDKETTLHLLPHWNWKGDEGEFKQVICYTNCEEVKLYLNDRLVGTRGYDCPRYGAKTAWNDRKNTHPTTNDLHLMWDVPYEPGVLRAEGYRDGEIVAVTTVETTGEAVQLEAKLWSAPTGTDMSNSGYVAVTGEQPRFLQVEVSALDSQGRLVPEAEFSVSCEISGNAHLVGMDAGNLMDLSLYGNPFRKMLAGRIFALIQVDGPGEIQITFQSGEMKTRLVVPR